MAQEKMHPFWIHAGIVGAIFLGGLGPIIAFSYASIVAHYYFLKWIFKSFIYRDRWFYLARRFLIAFVLSIPLGIVLGHFIATGLLPDQYDTSYAAKAQRQAFGTRFVLISVTSVMGLTPVTFCALYLFAIPVAIVKWTLSISQKRKRERESEASRRENERLSQLRSEENSRKRADDVKRAEIRAKCELHYERYAPELVERFPRARFDAFVRSHLSDSHDVSYVLARGKELVGLIESQRRAIVPDVKPQTIADISKWYLGQKQEIESLPIDEDMKNEHLVALDIRYAEITQEFLQKMGPS